MLIFFTKIIKNVNKNICKCLHILPVIFTQNLSNETTYIIKKKNLLLSLFCLKLHMSFQYKILSCISGVDYLGTSLKVNYRFALIYELLSLIFNVRLKIKIFVDELSSIFSSASVFVNSNWWEREIWDMFGLWFENHPDLRRILTDYGFDGFPLRKDFPLVGYFEIIYNLKKKRISAQPCEFSQEFRIFIFEDSWI